MSKIFLISGPPGAGKSTLAKELVTRFSKSIHIECDVIYNMVGNGYIQPWLPEAKELRELMYKSFASVASIYLEAGFVVVSDYVWNKSELQYLKSLFPSETKFSIAFLLPNKEVNVGRDHGRDFSVGEKEIIRYRNEFDEMRLQGEFQFYDNSSLTPAELANAILESKP